MEISMKRKLLAVISLAALAMACSPPAAPVAAAPEVAPPPAPVALVIPSGEYTVDPNHASLRFDIMHLGLAEYNARLTKFDAKLNVDAANPTASTLSFAADAASVRTDYSGNFQATHKGSPYKTWDEALAKQFLGLEKQPKITFTSTSFTQDGGNKGTLVGDLSIGGVSKPVTFEVELSGQVAEHPFTKAPAVGFEAEGKIKRSDYGIATDGFLNGALGDEVEIEFNGEFYGPTPPPVPAAPAAQ